MALHEDEGELLNRVAEGDRDAFTTLYSRYINDLYRYLYLFTKSRKSSEEIIQKVFVKIWERRASLGNIAFFKAYLYRAAKNLLLDEIRRNQRQEKMVLALTPVTEECQETSDAKIIYSQYWQIAQDAINLLPEKRRQIVELRTKEHLTLDEIAGRLSISKGVVKKQLYTGMNFVREYLQKHAELTSLFMLFLTLFQ
jgi:RNA polymerase sigma-70 factor (ECF subfamily)